jgi:hypothetical protein
MMNIIKSSKVSGRMNLLSKKYTQNGYVYFLKRKKACVIKSALQTAVCNIFGRGRKK